MKVEVTGLVKTFNRGFRAVLLEEYTAAEDEAA